MKENDMKKNLIIGCCFIVVFGGLFWRYSTPNNQARYIASDIPDFDFASIEQGSFMMGSPKQERYRQENENQAKVNIAKSFEIMTTEVTQKQWFDVMDENPSHFNRKEHCQYSYRKVTGGDGGEVGLCPNHPVESVSWEDVQEFIKKLNTLENHIGCDGTPNSSRGCYRLPTEAEWEFAARAGATSVYYFGNDSNLHDDHAWSHRNSSKQTQMVGQKNANNNRLFDMNGNVWEWVQDKYTETLPGGTNPIVTSGHIGIVRGGSWYNWSFADYMRSAYRFSIPHSYRLMFVGFRIVKTL